MGEHRSPLEPGRGLNRTILENYNITFDENVYSKNSISSDSENGSIHSSVGSDMTAAALPENVEVVREILLQLDRIIPITEKV